jgi:IS5 family transposase
MRPNSRTSLSYDLHHKTTWRESFLYEMDVVIAKASLCTSIEPHYLSGERGRSPIGTPRMLRIYCLLQLFNRADPPAEDSLYDSAAMRGQ